jgi:pimeloyl-ACP methyl ester carboxylesterase/DNA-binding CsgD family transcriptional regulator
MIADTMSGIATSPRRPPSHGTDQQIRFCRASDGTRLAFASHGTGPPLVVVSCWLSHLQYDWQSPVWRHFLDDLGAISTLIRYDERGFGLSDWDVDDFSLDARLGDLGAVVGASGLERFALLGMSGGAPVAMAYAAKHPDRVSRLVLYGALSGGWALDTPEKQDEEETWRGMIRVGWAKPEPTFRRVFTSGFIPDADEEQLRWFDGLQRMSTSTQNAIQSRIGRQQVDIADLLPTITTPTLSLHALGDRMNEFADAVELASVIPNARLVPLESQNHILLQDEPAWRDFVREVTDFLEPDRLTWAAGGEVGDGFAAEPLSPRELDVLRLAAEGQTNDEIAAALTLSPRTVERHLSNIYLKIGVSGRAARTAAVGELLRGHLT